MKYTLDMEKSGTTFAATKALLRKLKTMEIPVFRNSKDLGLPEEHAVFPSQITLGADDNSVIHRALFIPRKKNSILSDKGIRQSLFHESGHALDNDTDRLFSLGQGKPPVPGALLGVEQTANVNALHLLEEQGVPPENIADYIRKANKDYSSYKLDTIANIPGVQDEPKSFPQLVDYIRKSKTKARHNAAVPTMPEVKRIEWNLNKRDPEFLARIRAAGKTMKPLLQSKSYGSYQIPAEVKTLLGKDASIPCLEETKQASDMYHYAPPEFADNVRKHGIQSMGVMLKSKDPRTREYAKQRLVSYARFLEKGQKPTNKNILGAVRKFRQSPQGEHNIYGLQEKYDVSKGNEAGNKWLGDRAVFKILVDKLRENRMLAHAENLDAGPIDYSKLKDKAVFADVPHPSIRVKGNVIPPPYLEEIKQAADKGWLGVQLPSNVAKAVKALHKSIDKKDLTEDGFEKDPHITLAYGIAEKMNPIRVKGLINKTLPMDVTLGPLTAFKNDDATVLKFDIKSWDMKQTHKRIKKTIGMPGSTYDEFKPHLTVAYLKPGTDIAKYKKLEKGLKGKSFLVRDVDYHNGDTEMELKTASITLDIEKGDTLLGGRFKNVKTVVKEIGTDDLGQPTINGKKLLSFRIAKNMPMEKNSIAELAGSLGNRTGLQLARLAGATGLGAVGGAGTGIANPGDPEHRAFSSQMQGLGAGIGAGAGGMTGYHITDRMAKDVVDVAKHPGKAAVGNAALRLVLPLVLGTLGAGAGGIGGHAIAQARYRANEAWRKQTGQETYEAKRRKQLKQLLIALGTTIGAAGAGYGGYKAYEHYKTAYDQGLMAELVRSF